MDGPKGETLLTYIMVSHTYAIPLGPRSRGDDAYDGWQ